MPRIADTEMVGRDFGKWRVLKRAGTRDHWLCRCICGQKVEVLGTNLRSRGSMGCRDCALKRKIRKV